MSEPGSEKVALGPSNELAEPVSNPSMPAAVDIEEPDAAEYVAEDGAEAVANAVAEASLAEGGAKKKKKKKSKKKKQTEPPSVGLSKLYPSLQYPVGEIDAVNTNLKRTTDEEKAAAARDSSEHFAFVNDLRKGAEIHREVRRYARKIMEPGLSMTTLAEKIEKSVQQLAEGATWKEAGTGFPTGLSVNDCAAHWTPNTGDTTVLHAEDVVKVDFGVHVNGRIIDSAFTHTFDPRYDPLVQAVREATNTGVREAGIDVRLCDIGAAVQETMESFEVELDGKVYPVKCIRNLNGHNIAPYVIHGGKSVPIIDNGDQTKMEEGEVFAIETFGSTGRGYVINQGEVSHYALNKGADASVLHTPGSKRLYKNIKQTFGTLPFCRRYLEQAAGEQKYLFNLNTLVKYDIVQDYPPLMDSPGSYTAQFEHTLVLRPTCKEVLSRGDDF